MDQHVNSILQRDQEPAYPVKLVSRSLPLARTTRLRVSWFILGIAFGVGCQTAFLQTDGISIPQIAETAPVLEKTPVPTVVFAEPKTTPVELIVDEETDTEATVAEAALNAAQEAAPSIVYPLKLSLKVGNGDTLSAMLEKAGISADEAYAVIQAMRKHYNPRKMALGQDVHVEMNKASDTEAKPYIQNVLIPLSVTSSIEVTRNKDKSFEVKKLENKVERKMAHAGGIITSSLYETGLNTGIPLGLLPDIINAYSYDVDFQRDIHEGHAIDVLFEKLETEDGKDAGFGNVLFAELDLGNRNLKIYRFVDSGGDADYYNDKGESVRKGLLRTPINGAKITSRFGMRNHPILGYSRMHRGVDFGAPIGTPIYAAGDGKVDYVGKKGGYGNYLRIKHNTTYSTAYAHLSRFASGVKSGSKVRQGQIVAYVGTTGQSTGPHLHYEVLANGTQVNPANIKFKTGNVLAGKELAAFRKNVEQIKAMVASTPKETKVAQLSGKPSKVTD